MMEQLQMIEQLQMMEQLLSKCLQSSMDTELAFLDLVRQFEAMRRRCSEAETELKKYKELLVKSDVAKAALDVKLKHARNQLDLEMKKRFRIERDFQYLQRQMQLVCDILVQDSKSSACLNDEQRSLLATFESKNQTSTVHRTSRRSDQTRLSVIDESSFLSHSDISYDRTDDDVDLDSMAIKPLKSRARERRRSSMGVVSAASGPMGKRLRANICTEIQTQVQDRKHLEKKGETTVKAKESGQSHVVWGISQERPDQTQVSRPNQDLASTDADQTSLWSPLKETLEPDTENVLRTSTFSNNSNKSSSKHVFISKTVIRPESCCCCGKRMRFGKMMVKCKNCRVVLHSECKSRCPLSCSSNRPLSQIKPGSLESFCPSECPRLPLLVVDCIAEIERRGLKERGLYRVPGGDRSVKELRERFFSGKTPLNLGKVEDVHVICGVLKDFLRKLPEPLLTFRLHPRFMEAGDLDDESGTVVLYKAISELPPTNKDTLAFLLLHLHKVVNSAECHMDQSNLCRVFGPTVVGHGLSEPSPSTILRDTTTQLKVMGRLLSVPVDYWRRVLSQTDQSPNAAPLLVSGTASCSTTNNQDEGHSRLFKPLTSPELNLFRNRQGSVTERLRNLGHNTGQADASRRFFTSLS